MTYVWDKNLQFWEKKKKKNSEKEKNHLFIFFLIPWWEKMWNVEFMSRNSYIFDSELQEKLQNRELQLLYLFIHFFIFYYSMTETGFIFIILGNFYFTSQKHLNCVSWKILFLVISNWSNRNTLRELIKESTLWSSSYEMFIVSEPVESVHISHWLSHLQIGLIWVFLREQLTHSMIQSLA